MPFMFARAARPQIRQLAALTAAVAAVLIAGPASASAATLYVSPPPGGSDADDCLTPATACATIQHAVDEAAAGDVIRVGPGSYDEIVSVTKALTLAGAQAGVDARDRTGASESILTASGGGFAVTASDVTIDGFTVEGVSGPPYGVGIYLSSAHSGYRVVNNVIRDNIFGLYANASGAGPSLIERNRFEANNRPGSSSGNAIYADQGTQDLTIDENFFTGHESAAAVFAGSDQSGITVSGNELVDDNSFAFFGTDEATVSGNTSTDSRGSIVFLGGGNEGIEIVGNRFLDGATSAVRVTDISTGPNQAVRVIRNVISGNAFGVNVDDAAHAGVLDVHGNGITGNGVGVRTGDADPGDGIDATENWWGCNEGPGQPGCDTFSGGVTADPWLVLDAAAAAGSIVAGETAAVTARLDRNSDGEAAAFPVADGVSASFAAAIGTISPPVAPFAGGAAASTYSATGGPGEAGITVVVGSEAVPVALSVSAPAAPPPPLPPDPEPVVEPPAAKTIAVGAVGVLGTITCPTESCTVSDKRAVLRVGGRRYRLKILLPRKIRGGESADIRVFLRREVREALRRTKSGRLVVRLTVVGADGEEVPVTLRVRLKPKR